MLSKLCLVVVVVVASAVACQTSVLVVAASPSASISSKSQGLKQTEIPECPPRFTRDYRPVCATNGRVYANRSIFAYHACRAAILEGRMLLLQDMAACSSNVKD
ncbi:hypothetical protein PybrP1_013097 [[Pythium] brassicae (nom. inval.)]|nr:hypothetical protein PybrP1_013097 [[Pythium] brassicae (nom. inval.)]